MSKPFSNCLLASDIDGTLMANGKIPQENIDMINRFTKDGGTFVLATGRGSCSLAPIKKFLKVLPLAIVYNGGMIYNDEDNDIIFQKILNSKDKEFIYGILKNTNCGIEVYSANACYVLNVNSFVHTHHKYIGLTVNQKTFKDIENLDLNKAVFFPSSREDYDFLFAYDKQFYSKSRVIKSAAYIDGEKLNLIELPASGVSKAYALNILKEKLSIKDGGLFAIGDYDNDIEMLKAADVSACPSDAAESVKKIVNFVGCSCSDGAVADFIKYLAEKGS